jgi:hypothetical protein
MGRFRMAWRALRAAPLTSAAAVTLIAVGVGANSAVFAVTYQLLLKPLPYAQPSRLMIVSIGAPDVASSACRWRTSSSCGRGCAPPSHWPRTRRARCPSGEARSRE